MNKPNSDCRRSCISTIEPSLSLSLQNDFLIYIANIVQWYFVPSHSFERTHAFKIDFFISLGRNGFVCFFYQNECTKHSIKHWCSQIFIPMQLTTICARTYRAEWINYKTAAAVAVAKASITGKCHAKSWESVRQLTVSQENTKLYSIRDCFTVKYKYVYT